MCVGSLRMSTYEVSDTCMHKLTCCMRYSSSALTDDAQGSCMRQSGSRLPSERSVAGKSKDFVERLEMR